MSILLDRTRDEIVGTPYLGVMYNVSFYMLYYFAYNNKTWVKKYIQKV